MSIQKSKIQLNQKKKIKEYNIEENTEECREWQPLKTWEVLERKVGCY